MKYFIVFLAVCVALASAAPQWLGSPWLGTPGLAGTYLGYNPIISPLAPRTLVAGPTVVNGWGGRIVSPGLVGTTLI